MKWFLVFILCGLARSADVKSACIPGSVSRDNNGVNTCLCKHNGYVTKCAITFDHAIGKYAISKIDETSCQPNTLIEGPDGLHTCLCGEDGRVKACSLRRWLNIKDSVSSSQEIADEPVELVLGNRVKRHVCTPGSNFLQGCNVCKCDQDGTSFACTQNECVEKGNGDVEVFMESEERKSANKSIVCEAKSSFAKECNTCWCNDDGTSYFCTRKVCVPTPDDKEELPEEMQVIKKECRPREVFELDCNTCRCHDDGQSFFCTRRVCTVDSPPDAVDYETKSSSGHPAARRLKRQADSKSVVKQCEPNESFRMDCNTCLCHKDGTAYACTRHDCTAPQPVFEDTQTNAKTKTRRRREVRSSECVPGSVFSQGCNVCRCTADGQHASCTLNKCAPPPATPDNHLEDESSEAESGYRCTPGEQFKRNCNDCACSADGKSYFCTIKLCEKDIVSQLSQS